MLIENKSEVNIKCTPGWTPLDLATHQGNVDIVKARAWLPSPTARKRVLSCVLRAGPSSTP